MIVWCDGAVRPLEAVAISPLDRGVLLGDGVFATMRVEAGAPERFGAHMDRLAAAAERLAIPLPHTPDELRAAIAELARELAAPSAAARITITRGEGPRGLAPPAQAAPRAWVTLVERHAPSGPAILALAPARRAASAVSPQIKSLSYIENVQALASARALAPQANEALILDTFGRVSGAAAANLFWVRAGALCTPSVHCAIRPGVTRAALIEAARRHGLEVREAEARPVDLIAAEAVGVTNSLIGLRPVSELVLPHATHRFDPAHPLLRRAQALERASARREA